MCWCNGVLARRFVKFDNPDTQSRQQLGRQSHVIELQQASLSTGDELTQPSQSSGGEALDEMPNIASPHEEQAMALYVVLVVIFTFLPSMIRTASLYSAYSAMVLPCNSQAPHSQASSAWGSASSSSLFTWKP